ncbi:heat shock 70 kDa protein 14 [Culicoides brevitarsis]|uniref:heat shock 70 kDa protein 14 n=1 Tax=Culicoides brevitarsis TaxID=469753 RepID=UPI00307BC044
MANSACFGIHLGNTNGCIALSKDKVDVIANEAGDFVTPAVLTLLGDGSHVVGLPAKQQRCRNVKASAINVLQSVSCDASNEEDFDRVNQKCGGNLSRDGDELVYNLERDEESKTFTPQAVVEEILKYIHSIADHSVRIEEKTYPVVMSVPTFLGEKSRQVLCEAAQKVGFHVLQVITNPASACLAYDVLQDTEPCNILVYRMGNVSTEATILRAEDGFLTIKHTVHDENLGGKKFTDLMVEYIAKEFYQKYKLDPNESKKTMAKLFQHAENTKHILSNMQTAHIFVESLMDGVDFSHNISRARYENLFASIVPLYKKPLEQLLAEANFNIADIHKIILCGGGMKIPKLKTEITSMFPNAKLLTGLNEDEVLALGCVKQASIISKQWNHDLDVMDMELNFLPCDIVLQQNGSDTQIEAFKARTLIPAYTKFTSAIDTKKNKNVVFDIFEKKSDELTKIGQIEVNDVAEDAKEAEFSVKIDSNGVAIVVAQ